MKRTTTYRWATVTVAAAAGLAVLTAALAAPFSTTAPTTAPAGAMASATTRPAGWSSSQPVASSSSWGGRSSRDRSRDRSRDDRNGSDFIAKADLPAGVSTKPKPMSSAFDAVMNRSIFMKGEQRIGRSRGDDRPNTFFPPTALRPQETLVFRGFTQVGDGSDAMIEDTLANKIFTVRPGELLAGGRITAITFDDLDYTYGGKVTKVSIGQNLDGQMASAGSSDPPTTAPSPSSTTPVDPAPSLGTTAGLSAEDILARMKKRRQMEMGGK